MQSAEAAEIAGQQVIYQLHGGAELVVVDSGGRGVLIDGKAVVKNYIAGGGEFVGAAEVCLNSA